MSTRCRDSSAERSSSPARARAAAGTQVVGGNFHQFSITGCRIRPLELLRPRGDPEAPGAVQLLLQRRAAPPGAGLDPGGPAPRLPALDRAAVDGTARHADHDPRCPDAPGLPGPSRRARPAPAATGSSSRPGPRIPPWWRPCGCWTRSSPTTGPLGAGRDEARPPSWRTSTGRRPDRVRWQAAAGEQPGDHRVGVPHLARPKLVPAPDGAGQRADQLQEPTRQERVVAQDLRARDRLGGIRDDPVPPTAHLVTEHPPAPHRTPADRALDGHPARRAVGIRDRPAVLDDKASLWQAHLERRVVQVQRPPVLQARVDGLPDAPVQLDEPATGTQWEPVQLDAPLASRWRDRELGGAGRVRLHDRLLMVTPRSTPRLWQPAAIPARGERP
jgi:hypothetical protein